MSTFPTPHSNTNLHDDIIGVVQGASPAGDSDPDVREPVCNKKTQTDRKDGQRVEQQALQPTDTIALLGLCVCMYMYVMYVCMCCMYV